MEKFSVTDLPKIILDDKIIFCGLPKKEEILEILWGLLSLYWNWITLGNITWI